MELLWVLYYVPADWSYSRISEFSSQRGAMTFRAPADVPFWWRHSGTVPVVLTFIVPSVPVEDERQISLCL